MGTYQRPGLSCLPYTSPHSLPGPPLLYPQLCWVLRAQLVWFPSLSAFLLEEPTSLDCDRILSMRDPCNFGLAQVFSPSFHSQSSENHPPASSASEPKHPGLDSAMMPASAPALPCLMKLDVAPNLHTPVAHVCLPTVLPPTEPSDSECICFPFIHHASPSICSWPGRCIFDL